MRGRSSTCRLDERSIATSHAVGSSAARWLWVRAMVELGWRSRLTLTTFYIAAGTLAAAHCSLLLNHCAISPNSGSEHSWGISLTQDSRDSFIDSGCHSNMVAVGQMSVPSRASAHRVDSLQAMLDCYASLPFSASAELGRLASSC